MHCYFSDIAYITHVPVSEPLGAEFRELAPPTGLNARGKKLDIARICSITPTVIVWNQFEPAHASGKSDNRTFENKGHGFDFCISHGRLF